MRDYLKKIAGEGGISILVSSHLLAEMEQMCNRVVVIQEGKLVTVRTLGTGVSSTETPSLASDTASQQNSIKVNLRVRDVNLAKAAIVQMEFVRIVTISTERNELTVSLRDNDIPGLVSLLAKEGIGIYRIEEVKETLEDEFLKWTGGNQIA
ncbi:hypothetical protein D3C78_1522160 [compost metagenome]